MFIGNFGMCKHLGHDSLTPPYKILLNFTRIGKYYSNLQPWFWNSRYVLFWLESSHSFGQNTSTWVRTSFLHLHPYFHSPTPSPIWNSHLHHPLSLSLFIAHCHRAFSSLIFMANFYHRCSLLPMNKSRLPHSDPSSPNHQTHLIKPAVIKKLADRRRRIIDAVQERQSKQRNQTWLPKPCLIVHLLLTSISLSRGLLEK